MKDYSEVTQEQFDNELMNKVNKLGVNWLMGLAGVYEIVSEELNNSILDALSVENDD